MSRRHRLFLRAGLTALVFALLPWLGLGGHSFAIPGTSIIAPRLDDFSGPVIYGAVAFPVHCLGLFGPLHGFVFFQGEGALTARPFVVFIFWLLIEVALVWVAIRPILMKRVY